MVVGRVKAIDLQTVDDPSVHQSRRQHGSDDCSCILHSRRRQVCQAGLSMLQNSKKGNELSERILCNKNVPAICNPLAP